MTHQPECFSGSSAIIADIEPEGARTQYSNMKVEFTKPESSKKIKVKQREEKKSEVKSNINTLTFFIDLRGLADVWGRPGGGHNGSFGEKLFGRDTNDKIENNIK